MLSESELLEGARRFDAKSLAQIYDCYSPRLYRYAMRFLGDANAAEDCVAETFARFLQALSARNGPRNFLQAYLYRVAHNLIADGYRGQPPPDNLDDQDLCSIEDPEEEAGKNIRRMRLLAALRQLTPDQQQVIMLKFLEGWENKEIAHALNKPVGAVKSLQHRALTQLHQILEIDE